MSLAIAAGGNPVHFPANPNKFAFDGEVARIFNDMASRSIPNFHATHTAHAEMVLGRLERPCDILDIGASRGAFYSALVKAAGMDVRALDNLHYSAVDNSPQMCDLLRTDFPAAKVYQMDIAKGDLDQLSDKRYDVVCAHYVLQFVKPEHQIITLLQMFKLVRPGGLLIFGHKGSHSGELGDLAHDQYIKFRRGNGYTLAEIEAKTEALKNSMFPMSHDKLMRTFSLHFTEIQETFRFMMFSTFLAVK